MRAGSAKWRQMRDAAHLPIYMQAFVSTWGKRRLNRYKHIDGKLYQLHATRGWKAA